MTTRTADTVVFPPRWATSAAPATWSAPRKERHAPPALCEEWLPKARALLLDRVHQFVAAPASSLDIDVEVRGTAIVATLRCPGFVHRVVLKPSELNGGVREAAELERVLAAIAASNPRIAR